jgi:hypothetical protein
MMTTSKVNPFLTLACFGAACIAQGLATGQIADRRWTAEDVVRELGVSLTTQWRWRKEGKLGFIRYGSRFYYTSLHLREAGLL